MNVALFKVTETAKLLAQVQAEEPQGELDSAVHSPYCFIVTTRFPDADWQPTSEPLTCGFCIKEAGGSRPVGGSKPQSTKERLYAQALAELKAEAQEQEQQHRPS